jgi:hypothetical protein
MAQPLGHLHVVLARAQGQRRERMSKIVKPHCPQTQCLAGGLEVIVVDVVDHYGLGPVEPRNEFKVLKFSLGRVIARTRPGAGASARK